MFFKKKLNTNTKYLFYALFIIIIIKLISINNIHKKRELPIEPDDAYFYMTHSFLFYEDFHRTKKTAQSIKDIIYTTYEHEISENSQDLTEVGKIERLLTPMYYLYTKIFGFINKKSGIDNNKLWWIFNYASQILIIISSFMLIQKFLPSKKIFYKIIVIISSFFFVVSAKHQLMGTPLTIGASILLMGICLSLNNNKYYNFIGTVLIFLSLHFHPGTFLISSVFIGTYFILYIIYKKKEYLYYFIKIFFPVFVCFFLEQFLFLLEIDRYLGIFETQYVEQEFAKKAGLIEFFHLNWSNTKRKFIEILYPLTPFFFQKSLIILPLYLISVLVSYKTNKELFILNCFIFISIIIGCFYFISINHTGNMIYYQMLGFIPILSIIYFNMYFFFCEKLEQKLNIKKPVILIILVLIIFINNLANYLKIIEHRTNKTNLENITIEIKKFSQKHMIDENDAMIIGDELVLLMYWSFFQNTNIYLDNRMRKGNKIWHSKNNTFKPKGYIGKIDENKIIKNTISYGQNSFTFNNIKKFKNFYFLYN
jgi:hypothetical protein